MSILSTSRTSIRIFDVNIANALNNSKAATILQQLHYWMQKKNAGIKINRIKYLYNTFKDWVQEQFLYLTDWKFKKAIALFKVRKREQHIPNPCGYFVTALKENWGSNNFSDTDSEVDRASVFRYWYNLARELGYCSGQEVKEGEQWVCLTGTWEKWSKAVERGYSINYLKKIVKRNGGK